MRDRLRRVVSFQWLLLLGVALAVRGLFVPEPPGRDQGLFFTEADLLLRGARLYDQVWEHKPPGILALYATARWLSPSYVAVHLLNAVAVVTTALMLRALCRRRGLSEGSALFGALLYLVFATGPAFGGFWMIAQPEVFLDPLLCASLLLIGRGTWRSTLLAGIAVGTAIAAIKYSALPLLLLVLLPPKQSGAGMRAQRRRLSFVLGCALPPAALLAYFAATGRAQAWFDITVRFNLEHARVGHVAMWSDPLAFGFPLLLSLFVFYAFGIGAAVDRIRRGTKRAAGSDALLQLGAGLWLLGLAQVALQGKFWTYHYHVMLIPFAILAAVGFERMRTATERRLSSLFATLTCALVAALSCGPYIAQVALYARQHDLLAAICDDASRERFYLQYRWGKHDYNFGVDRIVASQLAATTRPDDTILIWGFEPLLYSLAARKPASRFLYDYPLMPRFSRHARYVRQLMNDLHAHPPAVILVLHDDVNDLEQQDSATQLAALPELAAYVQRGYAQAWSAGRFTAYARTR